MIHATLNAQRIRFHSIISPSYVDGPGRRATLFLQGCSIRCPGCQNPHLWPATDGHGHLASPQALADILIETGLPITISGGEPFDQAADLYNLLYHIKTADPNRHVIVYSGHTFEALLATHRFEILAALALADILVDGPYIQDQDDPLMQYRGSRNQRVIDLPATCARPIYDVLTTSGPVLLDWDTPELILTTDGDLLASSPIAADFAALGHNTFTRRCGETGGAL